MREPISTIARLPSPQALEERPSTSCRGIKGMPTTGCARSADTSWHDVSQAAQSLQSGGHRLNATQSQSARVKCAYRRCQIDRGRRVTQEEDLEVPSRLKRHEIAGDNHRQQSAWLPLKPCLARANPAIEDTRIVARTDCGQTTPGAIGREPCPSGHGHPPVVPRFRYPVGRIDQATADRLSQVPPRPRHLTTWRSCARATRYLDLCSCASPESS